MTSYSNISTEILIPLESWITVGEGGLLFLFDLLIALFIVSRKDLRSQKELLIYFGIMIYDSFWCLGFAISGVKSLILSYNEKYIPLSNPWACFNNADNYIYIFTIPGVGLITLCSAVDRFISITFPLKYFRLDTKYSICLIASPILLMLPIFIIATIQAYDARDRVKLALCDLIGDDMPPILDDLRWIRVCATIIAILLYSIIFTKIYFILKASKFKASNQEKNIIRATITVSLLVINELVFIVLPDIYLYLYPDTYLAGVVYILVMSKGVGNILLVLFMQRDLRHIVVKFVKKILQIQSVKPTIIYIGT